MNRSTDLVARHGGEEFVLLAAMIDLVGVRGLTHKLLQAVETLTLPRELSPLGRGSVSIGVTASVPRSVPTAQAANTAHR